MFYYQRCHLLYINLIYYTFPDSYVIIMVYFMDNAQKFVAPILLLQDPHTISLIVSDDKFGCFRLIS
jgi:hypothetical protein